MISRKKIRIGDLLVEHNVISENQLLRALAEQKQSGHKLGRTLVELGFVTEDKLLEVLSRQLQLPFIELKHYKYHADTVRLLPETIARRYRAVALAEQNDAVLVGMADPTDIFAYDEIARVLKRPVRLAVVRESELLKTIDTVYRRTEEISNLAEELSEELSTTDFDLEELLETDDLSEAPVVKLLQSIFEDAVQVGASDIHIEPDEHVLRIRQRIDGMLSEQVMKEKRITNALVSRLKLMSGLDISERRLPQDGRFNIRVKGRNIDVRVSTMPIQYGESVVMRLLDQTGGTLSLGQIGMPDTLLRIFRRNIRKPNGMVLVTGPTGSGKTTTLYAALNELNAPEKKIITVEDPVEYRLPRINQVQVNSKVGLTFPNVLRTALRQDPDVVLIGEIRDQETAQIALRASITGHMVLSTLHTNDAISTAIRLVDMGAPGYMVATSLEAIIAQRLVRKVCEGCAEEHTPTPQQKAWIHAVAPEHADAATFQQGVGCPHCGNSGYHGRIGVFEVLEIDDELADALRRDDTSTFSHSAARSDNYHPLSRHALAYALQGITTLDEAIRVTSGELVEDEELPPLPQHEEPPQAENATEADE
ncbi:MAG: GspE/PulE family protein [Pseudomonadota bacterium]